ncbi:(2Fe-2S)-binding protein [Paenibacillus sp. CC-CFT747]|nr:(2Fe-2S)-binding protein [Paenibacillus sp. CC-CFT747]
MASRTVPFELELTVNGERRMVTVRASETLLEVLREKLGLTGSKPSCMNGDCGACTVQVNGVPVKACLMLAFEAAAADIRTIEGLRNEPLQREFIRQAAFQCGYCTSGFLMNIDALMKAAPGAGKDVIEEWLESNLCRCTGYLEIEAAVKKVLAHPGEGTGDDNLPAGQGALK